jgi:hypothetical protein
MIVPMPTRMANMNSVLTPHPLDPAPELEIISGTYSSDHTG